MTEDPGCSRRRVHGKDSSRVDRKLTGTHITAGFAASHAGVAGPSFGESSLTNPIEHPPRGKVEANRLRLIEQRLSCGFYEVPPASERIAALVLTELQDLEESVSVLPN